MAVPTPKPKRIKSKEDILKAAKGNIPEFDFFTSDGTVVVLYVSNRNGRVWIPGPLHEAFFELCQEHTAALKDAAYDDMKVPQLAELAEIVDDVPRSTDPAQEADASDDDPESIDPAPLYKTAAEKQIEFFTEHRAEIIEQVNRLSGVAMVGFMNHRKQVAAPINRDFYYKAFHLILDTDDPDIPEEYREEIKSDYTSKVYQDQDLEEVKTFVETFRSRVGF